MYSPLVPFFWCGLASLHILLTFCGAKVLWRIVHENGLQSTMPFSVTSFILMSLIGMATAEISTVLRIRQKQLFFVAKLANSVGLIFGGTFLIFSLLNICLYWIEIGTRTRQQANILRKSRLIVLISGALFFFPSVGYYAATLDVTFLCGMTTLYAIFFVFYFIKGRALIFQQVMPNFPEPQRYHLCNWMILFVGRKIVPLSPNPRQTPRLKNIVTETLKNIDACTKGLAAWMSIYVISTVIIVATSIIPEVGALTLCCMYVAPLCHVAVCAQVLGHLAILSNIKRSNSRRYIVSEGLA